MFPLKFSLALILGFVKFDKCADLVVPVQPTYVPRLKVLFPALPPLFLFHGDLKFSKSSVSALQDRWFLILPVNPFQLQFCLIPERHILSSRKVSHMHEFVVFSLPSNLVFLSPGGQMISSKISLDNQSKFEPFCSKLSSFFFSVPALMSRRHGLVEGQQS